MVDVLTKVSSQSEFAGLVKVRLVICSSPFLGLDVAGLLHETSRLECTLLTVHWYNPSVMVLANFECGQYELRWDP